MAETVDDGDSFQDRQNAINAVYVQGQEARKTMEKTGVVVDEGSCANGWTSTGANEESTPKRTTRKDNEAFQERRRLSFVNGCMDRPNSLPAVTDPAVSAAPRPSASS